MKTCVPLLSVWRSSINVPCNNRFVNKLQCSSVCILCQTILIRKQSVYTNIKLIWFGSLKGECQKLLHSVQPCRVLAKCMIYVFRKATHCERGVCINVMYTLILISYFMFFYHTRRRNKHSILVWLVVFTYHLITFVTRKHIH